MFTKGLVVLALARLLAGTAHAHHVVTEHGIAPVAPRTMMAVDVSAASFDFDGNSGRWEAITPSVEWRVLRPLSLFAALPLAWVHFEDGDGGTGLGDLSLSAKLSLVQTPHGGLLLSAGLGAELPTGNTEQSLGGGHVELSPFLTAASAFATVGQAELIAYGVVAYRLSLAGEHQHGPGAAPHTHAEGSVLAPHAEQELSGRVMLAAARGEIYAAAGGEGALVTHGEGTGQLAARAEVGWRFTERMRLSVSAALTLAGEERFGVRGSSGIAWLF